LESQTKKLFNKTPFGTVALLSDSTDLKSSQEILSVLQNKSIDVNIITVPGKAKDLIDSTIWQNFSRVFIALPQSHYLSSGHIQGLLELLCIDYTGSGMLAAALANDRVKSKKIWQMMGIATTPFVKWNTNINWQEIIGLLGFPVAVKSMYSHDQKVFKVANMDQLEESCQNFWNLSDVIIEPWITGDRYIVYIIEDQPLLPLYADSLVSENTKKEYYSRLNIPGMQKLAMEAFKAIGGQGLARVNIIKDLNDNCWVSSIDTSPLIMRNCNFSDAANNSGISFELLIEKILTTSFIKKTNHQRLHLFNKYFTRD
jgi:D-alanine-D-alanine ligase